ncbi:BTAD domain-containing putative transcriptional regulator [Micromonospora wenchangensis]|uniref:BTAD domain-containing putative transcriptional regulator n=1 Tax=Micromonospora wenchangensis TaxID=1185415 RepID=UPI003D737EB9
MTAIGVLGPVRAVRDGTPVALGAPRQRAVLARLVAGGGHVVSVDRLVDDLWAGDPPPRARAALQVYVSNLRRVLEPDRRARTPARVLVTVAPGYALRLPTAHVDAWRFEAALRSATPDAASGPVATLAVLDAALACWGAGGPYAEFGGEPWADREGERLTQLRATAVEQRAGLLLELDRPHEVVRDLDPHVREHPLRERAAMLLAVALYRLGRQADALDVLRAVRATLAEQLGIDPGRALRNLETDLLRQSPRLEPAVPGPPAHSTPGPPPVTATPRAPDPGQVCGRTAELARLRAAADRAARSGLGFCWLGAEAGAGKSTLVRQTAGALADAGWRTAVGTCPPVEGAPPAWAWREIVAATRRFLPPEETGHRGLHPLPDPDGPDDTGYDEFHLRRALAAHLSRLSGLGPLLLVVEDAHHADGATLRVLRHLAAALTGSPVLVVVTYRPDEVTDDVVAARAALAGVPAVEVTLGGLDAEAVTAVLRRHGVHDSALLRTLRERAAGNPLFAIELAGLVAAEGPAAALDGVPAGLGHLLARRLARLPAGARTVLRLAAVCGVEVDVDLLLAVDGGPEEPVLAGLEAGVTAGLLVEPAPGRVRFAHALMRDVLYHGLPLLRRTRLHARVLAVLREQRRDDVAALGRHALAALRSQPTTATPDCDSPNSQPASSLRRPARAEVPVGHSAAPR